MQEGNVFINYPSIFWYTVNLISMSGSVETEQLKNEGFETKEKTTNYGKTAKAISRVQSEGIEVTPPYINEAELSFVPNIEDNSIIFGLKGMTGINEETVDFIIKNRPYSNLMNFHKKLVLAKREVIQKEGKKQMKSYVTESQTITLIKAGCFDKIENKPREEILYDYLKILNPPKKKLDTRDIGTMQDMGIIPPMFNEELRIYNFREYLMTLKKFKREKDPKTVKCVRIKCETEEDTEYTNNFFMEQFASKMEEDKEFFFDEDGYTCVLTGSKRKDSFDDLYSKKIKPLTDWLQTEECFDLYNKIRFENAVSKFTKGNISTWEMESLSFYYHDHELKNTNYDKYNITKFDEILKEPEIVGYNVRKQNGEEIKFPKYALYNIVGTVLDRNKNKNMITLLTPEGVVDIKFYQGQFGFYDKKISMDNGVDEKTGKVKKITLEDSWFKRGNLLNITGYRRDDKFFPKRYKNSIYQHTVQLITEVKDNGDIIFQSDRAKVEDYQ